MSLIWGNSYPTLLECRSCQTLQTEEGRTSSVYNRILSNNVLQYSLKDINKSNMKSDGQLATKNKAVESKEFLLTLD
ncbi:hypothetical protein [Brevibacillus laterosporus]|uniref:hypothetical protein n=1 Tax=Brevibacillus laterosporus TaxID=1465 RepID=UPI000551242E|nr:hypothetical protein [Brevibacillus laterosporus]